MEVAAEDPKARFLRLIPDSGDPVLVLLRGHLLIEELLIEIIESRCKHPQVLKDARLSFFQVLRLAQALSTPKQISKLSKELSKELDLWSNIEKVNRVRNVLAHTLEPSEVYSAIDTYLGECFTDPKQLAKMTPDEKSHELQETLAFLCGQLAMLIFMLQEKDL